MFHTALGSTPTDNTDVPTYPTVSIAPTTAINNSTTANPQSETETITNIVFGITATLLAIMAVIVAYVQLQK